MGWRIFQLLSVFKTSIWKVFRPFRIYKFPSEHTVLKTTFISFEKSYKKYTAGRTTLMEFRTKELFEKVIPGKEIRPDGCHYSTDWKLPLFLKILYTKCSIWIFVIKPLWFYKLMGNSLCKFIQLLLLLNFCLKFMPSRNNLSNILYKSNFHRLDRIRLGTFDVNK